MVARACVTSFQWLKNTSILLLQFKVQLLSNWVHWKQTGCSKSLQKIWPTNKRFLPFLEKNQGPQNQAQGHFPVHSWFEKIFKSETEWLMRCLLPSSQIFEMNCFFSKTWKTAAQILLKLIASGTEIRAAVNTGRIWLVVH